DGGGAPTRPRPARRGRSGGRARRAVAAPQPRARSGARPRAGAEGRAAAAAANADRSERRVTKAPPRREAPPRRDEAPAAAAGGLDRGVVVSPGVDAVPEREHPDDDGDPDEAEEEGHAPIVHELIHKRQSEYD